MKILYEQKIDIGHFIYRFWQKRGVVSEVGCWWAKWAGQSGSAYSSFFPVMEAGMTACSLPCNRNKNVRTATPG
jgi:hypothetical protein